MAQKRLARRVRAVAPARDPSPRPFRPRTPAQGRNGPRPTADAGRIREIFVRLRDLTPEPKTELVHADPFTLLVAVALSAQATDVSVNKAAGPLFAVAGTPEAMLALGEEA